jgi:hypothetical protein
MSLAGGRLPAGTFTETAGGLGHLGVERSARVIIKPEQSFGDHLWFSQSVRVLEVKGVKHMF